VGEGEGEGEGVGGMSGCLLDEKLVMRVLQLPTVRINNPLIGRYSSTNFWVLDIMVSNWIPYSGEGNMKH
jgi:hypothetical protein